MGARRLFFAIWPRDSERGEIVSATRGHVGACGGTPTKPSNLHATLAFLGSVAMERIGCVEEAAGLVRSRPFVLPLDSLQYWKRPGILALCATRAPTELVELVQELWRELAACGFAPDSRPFRAHTTLARRADCCVSLDNPPCVAWKVDHFVLAESVTDHRGARYGVLRRWSLRNLRSTIS